MITLPPTNAELEHAFPIRTVVRDGREGFAIHCYNNYSQCWQAVGTWQPTYEAATAERAEVFDPTERALS